MQDNTKEVVQDEIQAEVPVPYEYHMNQVQNNNFQNVPSDDEIVHGMILVILINLNTLLD